MKQSKSVKPFEEKWVLWSKSVKPFEKKKSTLVTKNEDIQIGILNALE